MVWRNFIWHIFIIKKQRCVQPHDKRSFNVFVSLTMWYNQSNCMNNKNALTALAWRLDREMRRRLILHETGFSRKKFFTSYFIDVGTFYLFLNWFSTRVSDDRKYVWGRRPYACINTRKFRGLNSREITSLPEIKKVIYMARHFNHRRK